MPGFSAEPLHEAVLLGRKDLVEDALESGMAVDTRSSADLTPLMLAAQLGMEDIARLLLGAGADVNARTRRGYENGHSTPLHLAAMRGWLGMCRLLLAGGANPNAVDVNGETPLSEALNGKSWDVGSLFIKHGANPNGPPRAASPPLVIAATFNRIDLLEELLRRGADPNGIDRSGWSAAVSTVSPQCFKLLRSHGADVNLRNFAGQTILLANILRAPPGLIRCYIEAGADVNARDGEQRTALMRLADRPDLEVATMLVEAGADVNAGLPSGLSLVDYMLRDESGSSSTRVRRRELVDYLRSKGAKSTQLHN